MTYASDILQSTSSIKASKSDTTLTVDKFRGTVTGMALGALAGAVVGYKMKWSYLWCSFAGALAGGVISRALTNIKRTEDETE